MGLMVNATLLSIDSIVNLTPTTLVFKLILVTVNKPKWHLSFHLSLQYHVTEQSGPLLAFHKECVKKIEKWFCPADSLETIITCKYKLITFIHLIGVSWYILVSKEVSDRKCSLIRLLIYDITFLIMNYVLKVNIELMVWV